MDKDKIKKVEDRVRIVLEEKPHTRDDDMKLYAWIISKFYGQYLGTMPAKELIDAMYHSKIPHMTSILRCRQLLQQHNESLRGERYNERQKKSKEFKNDVVDWTPGQSCLFEKF